MMQFIHSYFRWFFFIFLNLFLIACKPTVEFIYSPQAPVTGELVTFDASKSTAYKEKEGNAIATYSWEFGDGSTANGKVAEHTYTTVGKYKVSLTITDLAGQTAKESKTITVKQGSLNATKPVNVLVQSANGALLANTTVTIHGQSTSTDQNGVALFDVVIPNNLNQVVATFEKDGFITQSILLDTANLSGVAANLLAIKQKVQVADITQAQTIKAFDLNASITIPENAFVKEDGSIATGAVNVEFTPWDITSTDLNAMPANGIAQDSQGNIVSLISAGMITATFSTENGEKLQLASGKTADIQIDLPLTSINNQIMSIGTEIPMWHFDEAKGLWIEEGIGHVVAATDSSTGLAVHATVSHFSTWNWDFKFENAGSVFVQCQSNGIAIPCHVTAKITLGDGSGNTYSNTIPATGLTVVNMPSSGEIFWHAKDISGSLVGEITSGTTGNVIIDLGTPTTDNLVKCTLTDGTEIACTATLNTAFDFDIAREGSRIITGIDDADDILQWTARTNIYQRGDSYYRATGSVTSSVTGNVNLILDQEQLVGTINGESFQAICRTDLPSITSCALNLYVSGYDENGNWFDTTIELTPQPINQEFTISLPSMFDSIAYFSLSSRDNKSCIWWNWEAGSPTETQEIYLQELEFCEAW